MKNIFLSIIKVLSVLFLLVQVWVFISLYWWSDHPVEKTMFMRMDAWENNATEVDHTWVNYSHMSPYIKQAVVTGEDGKFLEHHGFDWDGMQVALARNEENGSIVAGGSTITQQLAKNLFLYNQRSYFRKFQEAIITVMMEKMWSKKRILEVYLNSVEFGENLYGVEAASQYYFKKESKYLTKQESIFLAALLPDPKYFQNHPNDKKLHFREHFIMRYINSSQIP
ncbi:monofunctional biosynthetic peptidoglycan transglycosylase [Acinetobacter nectaris]|uniref:monofunctional biosynthetic peptidoglycan transglycosylase n=1 Tax=Acinetobacter nectaris TaxID=1219382 RepID=UPI001F011367|nr:monofunctional biosynthetic peptidoglycan transglycosylase [Acinetobacter nectaris]MCF9035077.1 monofunctional biosynthetic peptidoglycan transglycosylase [Acinetobacter nectaris]